MTKQRRRGWSRLVITAVSIIAFVYFLLVLIIFLALLDLSSPYVYIVFGIAVLVGAALLSPARSWMLDRLWRNQPVVDRLCTRWRQWWHMTKQEWRDRSLPLTTAWRDWSLSVRRDWSLPVTAAAVTIVLAFSLLKLQSIWPYSYIVLCIAALVVTALLIRGPSLKQDSFWRNQPVVDRLCTRWRRWRPVLLGSGVLAVIVLLVWQVPPALYDYVKAPKDRATAEASTRTGIIAGLAGLAALFGVGYTARTFRITKEGHLTDRYTKAIEQLGSDKLDVRLGGIYALERIAVDSRRDHPTVVEVLGAYVRQHAGPIRPPPTAARSRYLPRQRLGLADDVQAAVSVLGRLPSRDWVLRGNLTGAWLDCADLRGANLTGARLRGASLVRADLYRANLTDAWLDRADLRGANLTGARLGRANLAHANLRGANLADARLRGASLAHADLRSRVDLPDVLLIGAGLHCKDRKGNLARTCIRLYQANLARADLYGTNLTGANLRGADLTRARGLLQSQLRRARGDYRTKLPTRRWRPWHWEVDPAAVQIAHWSYRQRAG